MAHRMDESGLIDLDSFVEPEVAERLEAVLKGGSGLIDLGALGGLGDFPTPKEPPPEVVVPTAAEPAVVDSRWGSIFVWIGAGLLALSLGAVTVRHFMGTPEVAIPNEGASTALQVKQPHSVSQVPKVVAAVVPKAPVSLAAPVSVAAAPVSETPSSVESAASNSVAAAPVSEAPGSVESAAPVSVAAAPVSEAPGSVESAAPVSVAVAPASEPVAPTSAASAAPASEPVAPTSVAAPVSEAPSSVAAAPESKAVSLKPKTASVLAAAKTPKKKKARPRKPRKPLPVQLNRSQVMGVVKAKAKAVRACRQFTREPVTLQVSLTIAPNGRVRGARAQGVHQGTPLGSCVERKVRALRFPRFQGTAMRVRLPYSF